MSLVVTLVTVFKRLCLLISKKKRLTLCSVINPKLKPLLCCMNLICLFLPCVWLQMMSNTRPDGILPDGPLPDGALPNGVCARAFFCVRAHVIKKRLAKASQPHPTRERSEFNLQLAGDAPASRITQHVNEFKNDVLPLIAKFDLKGIMIRTRFLFVIFFLFRKKKKYWFSDKSNYVVRYLLIP